VAAVLFSKTRQQCRSFRDLLVRTQLVINFRGHRSIILLLGTLAMLIVACSGDESETVRTAAIRGDARTTAVTGKSSSPNTATLEWDAVVAPNLRGYRIYYGPDPDVYLQLPGKGIDAGNVTTYTITGLASGRRYYFAVTAFDGSNDESGFSNQVFKDIP